MAQQDASVQGGRPGAARAGYRHGDLRQALIDAGLEMAREGGPDAVVLREATRRAGVSPNAAYRHFADRSALVTAVSDAASGEVAAAIEREWDAVPPALDPVATAQEHLRAVGRGYLGFARDEPGLFRAAFTVPADLDEAFGRSKAGPGGRTPFELLASALDELVAAGALPEERRPLSEVACWSAVHGLAMLVLEGPLRGLPRELGRVAAQRVIEMAVRGV
ncbi:TetR/AcrR family transcriptional regulator [Pseudolysinimonas kribbensis]|uniref:TetR/AcrR family transcriptional regulator n=1 Tax=Pseudolysinimonas kribbensis TaxID=433641 RepID=UPI0031E46C12